MWPFKWKLSSSTYLVVVYYATRGGSNVWVSGWNRKLWPRFQWKLMSSTLLHCCSVYNMISTNVQRFLTNFFRGVFGRARRYLDWLCCVALCCILLSASYCVVLWCDVMCCDVSYLLLYMYFVGLKFLSFPVPSLHDLTQQLGGRTTVWPTRRLNKQNFHCVFFTGKHRFLSGIFVITTFYVPSVALVKLAKISSLSLTSAFWWPSFKVSNSFQHIMLKRIANLKGAP